MGFRLATDSLKREYFTFPPTSNVIVIATNRQRFRVVDFCLFSDRFITVTPLSDGPFRTDITKRDDVLLAFISLLLLLCIEGILASLLLRTALRTSTFGFSTNLVMEFIRDLRIPQRALPVKRISIRLLATAITLLVMVFGVEVLILFLSAPHRTPISNSKASFRLLFPINAGFEAVRFHARASIDRPCSAVSLHGVDQGLTRINACVTGNITGTPQSLFRRLSKEDPDITIRIETDVHRYGMEHKVYVDDLMGMFSARAFFSLGDQRARLMSTQEALSEHIGEQIRHVHRQYIAYLCSLYRRLTGDASMNIEKLNSFEQSFRPERGPGPEVKVINHTVNPFVVDSSRFTSVFTGQLPRGALALRIAQHVFRASAAIKISDPNENDLFVDERRILKASTVVWKETVRSLNWLSLCIMLGTALATLLFLRVVLKPLSTSELANQLVCDFVEAEHNRSRINHPTIERDFFHVMERENKSYRLGANGNDPEQSLYEEYTM